MTVVVSPWGEYPMGKNRQPPDGGGNLLDDVFDESEEMPDGSLIDWVTDPDSPRSPNNSAIEENPGSHNSPDDSGSLPSPDESGAEGSEDMEGRSGGTTQAGEQ